MNQLSINKNCSKRANARNRLQKQQSLVNDTTAITIDASVISNSGNIYEFAFNTCAVQVNSFTLSPQLHSDDSSTSITQNPQLHPFLHTTLSSVACVKAQGPSHHVDSHTSSHEYPPHACHSPLMQSQSHQQWRAARSNPPDGLNR